jgi:hypothetical protein
VKKWIGTTIIALLVLATSATAQETKGPTKTVTPDDSKAVMSADESKTETKLVVSELTKAQVQNLALRIDNAQLRAQAAQAAYDQARQELAALVQSLQREGYDLDLQTLTYTPAPAPQKKEPPK